MGATGDEMTTPEPVCGKLLAMKNRRSFLSALSAVPFLGLTTGCPGQTPAMVISEVEAGITDAEESPSRRSSRA